MNRLLICLLLGSSVFLTPRDAAAQCLQNGVPCGQNQSAIAGTPAPTTGTQIMGTDGTNSQPILVDASGRPITVVFSLPPLATGTNTIGSIANTGFNITGSLPAFAATPTFNLGTLNGAALDTTVNGLFKAGQNIGNTAFGISGTLPAYASTPTFNIGTAPTLNTNSQASVTTAAPSYANNSSQPLSLTTAGALRTDGSGVTQPVSGSVTANIGTTNGLALDTTVNGLFKSGQSIGNTSFGISGTLPAYAATPTFNIGTSPALTANTQGAVTTAAPSYTTGTNQALSLTTAGALRVDTGGTTQAVSGTVTANIGTTNGLALDTTVNGLFKAGQNIGNTSFASTQSGTWNVGLNAGTNAIGTVGVTALPPLAAGTNVIGSTLVANVFVETSTALAASGTFTGASRDSGVAGSPINYGFFTCFAFANAAGTLTMSGSNNNSTFYTVVNQTLAASTPLTTTSRIVFRYMRCAVTNGTTAQSTFVLNSQFGD